MVNFTRVAVYVHVQIPCVAISALQYHNKKLLSCSINKDFVQDEIYQPVLTEAA